MWGTVVVAALAVAGHGCGRPPATAAPPVAPAQPTPAQSSPPPAAAPPASASSPGAPDEYQALVVKAEAGEAVDFYRLRMAYLASPAFQGEGVDPDVEALRDQMFQAMRAKANDRVFELAQQVIARWYLDLEAHKARRQACKLIGRPDCEKYAAISLGLLRSVVQGRDGKSCETAWEVVSVAEEYFVIRMLDLTPKQQALIHEGHTCDRLDTADPSGATKTVYFDITAMMAASERAMRGAAKTP